MKKFSMMFLGLAFVTLLTGCGNQQTEKTLTCTSTEKETGMSMEQTISMKFKNDKLNHMKVDVNTKITDDDIKENWEEFTKSMDSQNEETDQDGVSLKITKDDKKYEYKVTLDIDIEKASKEALEDYGFEDLVNDTSTLEENKKIAEDDGFTCSVE